MADQEDMRERYAEVVTRWALMYPLGNWGIWGTADGVAREHLVEIAENIAAGWGRDVADRMLAVRDAELEAAREERDAARLVSKGRTMEEHDQAEELTRLRAALLERTAELAELRDLQIGLKSLTTDEGGIDMSLHMAHDMMRACVAGFVEILNEEPAPNYVEMRFSLRDDPDVYTVTIQRPGGKTPGEVADEWKARALQVEAAGTGTEARP